MEVDDDEGRVRVRSTLLTLAGGARALYCSTPASQAQVYNFHVRYQKEYYRLSMGPQDKLKYLMASTLI